MRTLIRAGLTLVLLCVSLAAPAAADPLYTSPSFTIPIGSPRVHPLAIATSGIGGPSDFTAIAGTVRGGRTASGGADAFLRVDEQDGHLLWRTRFGTASTDRATGVTAGYADGVAVAGWTTGSFGRRPNAGGRDAFLRAYERDGTLRWTRSFGTVGDETVTDVAFSSGLVVVVGSTSGTLRGGTAAGGDDAFAVAYSLTGERRWTLQFGSDRDDVVNALTEGSTSFAIAGTTAGSIPGADRASQGGTDGFSARFDLTDGDLSLIHQFGTPADDTATGIGRSAISDLIGGTTAGSFPGQASAGGLDGYMVSIPQVVGPAHWVTQFGSPGDDVVTGFVTDAAFAFAAGTTTGALGTGPSAGGSDGFVMELASSGDPVWTQQFGTPADEKVTSMATPREGFGVEGFAVVTGRRGDRPFWGLERPMPDELAQGTLQAGLAIAERWAAAHADSFTDFTVANDYLYPALFWVSGAPAGPFDISIDRSDATSVRLSTYSSTASFFCIESVGGVVNRGHSSDWDPSSCSGGW